MCDCEMPEFFIEEWRKARKPRPCGECSRTIKPKEGYWYFTGKWNGEVSNYWHCARCHRVREAIEKVSDCCVPLGQMLEELWQLNLDKKRHREWIRKHPPTTEPRVEQGYW
jgi:hypothetical protein